MKVFYFTGSGNSLSVAEVLKGELHSMPKLLRKEGVSYCDDSIGFVFPCYGSSIPTVVEQFLEENSFDAPYIFAIITYGMMALGTEKHFVDVAKKHGARIDYVNKLKMLDNSLKFYNMDKQLADLEKKQVEKHQSTIIQDINNRRTRKIIGNPITALIAGNGYKSYREEIGDCDKLFNVENHCTLCGTCEKVCPVNNIKVKDSVKFSGNCIRCYSCTHNCPVNAIRFEGEKSKTRYRHKDITLKKIIQANC